MPRTDKVRACNTYIVSCLGVCLIAVGVARLSPVDVSAATPPTITGISGTTANSQSLVISGSGFGTKVVAAPLVSEEFSGALNSALANHGPVTLNNFNNLRHAFSVGNARADFKVGSSGGGYFFEYSSGTSSRWFVQYWVKLASNWQWGTSDYSGTDRGLANVKIFRMFPIGARNYTNVGYAIHGFAGGMLTRFVENGVSPYVSNADARTWFPPGVWHSVQVQYGENSGVDQNDGTLKLWVDGVLRDSTTTLKTNVGSDGPAVDKRPYVIGFYDSWSPSTAAVANMYGYYSDIYVDNSWARVELGNASTYGACTRREIQIPTAWSANTVSVLVRQGGFTAGQVAYVYVVDSFGNVNPTGSPVAIGGGSIPLPAAPQNVKIIR